MMGMGPDEFNERESALIDELLRVIKAHTDSLNPVSAEVVAMSAAAGAMAALVIKMIKRKGLTPAVASVARGCLTVPWDSTARNELAKGPRP